jgi:hypothetical protein
MILLPALYHHVAIWVFGIQTPNDGAAIEPSMVQKLLHGSVLQRPMPKDSSGRENESAVPPVRPEIIPTTMTGLKHMICNNIRLSGLDFYFDKNPCLMIVPILSLPQAKENGKAKDTMPFS